MRRKSYRDIAFQWQQSDPSTLRRAPLHPDWPDDAPEDELAVAFSTPGEPEHLEVTYRRLRDPAFAEEFLDALIWVTRSSDLAGELLARMRFLVAAEFAEAAALAERQVAAEWDRLVLESAA